MKTLGICFGATTVQYVKLSVPEGTSGASSAAIEATGRVAHEGNPKGVALKLLSGPEVAGVDRVAVTGRAFRASVGMVTWGRQVQSYFRPPLTSARSYTILGV
jgi:hypothetical protein